MPSLDRFHSVIVLLLLMTSTACDSGLSERSPSTQSKPTPITAEAVAAHVDYLASDRLEGRGAGYAGEALAATYIAEAFAEAGLEPQTDGTYLQEFDFPARSPRPPGALLRSRNVIGVLKGSDSGIDHELVVLGAHFDGQGRAGQADGGRHRPEATADEEPDDDIWNSADDNASSVAVLIEVARRLAAETKAERQRSIVFVAFGAEEHALNGSFHYVDSPPFPIDDHVAMINLEKLGRVPDQELAVASSGTSPEWDGLIAAANERTGRQVETVIAELIADTDHYPFALARIPAIVIGTVHEEDTHLPSDEADRIDAEALASRAEFVVEMVNQLVTGTERLEFTAMVDRELGAMFVSASEEERTLLDLPATEGALKTSAILSVLPAGRSGLQVGDFVLALGGEGLAPDASETAVAETFGTDGSVRLEVVRSDERRVIAIE